MISSTTPVASRIVRRGTKLSRNICKKSLILRKLVISVGLPSIHRSIDLRMLLKYGTDQLLTWSERYQIEFAVQYMFHRSITIHKSESSCNMIVCQSSIELGLSVRSVWNKAQAQARSLDLISLYLISQVVDEEARRTTWTSFWFELSRVELSWFETLTRVWGGMRAARLDF